MERYTLENIIPFKDTLIRHALSYTLQNEIKNEIN
jgi:hypothetical protein